MRSRRVTNRKGHPFHVTKTTGHLETQESEVMEELAQGGLKWAILLLEF